MIDILWDVHQQGRINQTGDEVERLQRKSRGAEDRIRELEFTLHRMALASQAMWELVRETTGITEAQLLARMTEIDLRDGQKDGRMSPQVLTCPQCQRPVSSKIPRCMYCGTDVPRQHVFG